jgi:hypothetical protein
MTVSINGTSGLVFNDASTQATAATGFGFKNRLINGDCRIDQRNAGAAVTADGSYPVDRFIVFNSTDGAYSGQQDSSAPTGFVNSLKMTTTTADASLGATQSVQVIQRIEGFNTSDLMWGTASAQPVTLSFWVRSSLTGTFGGSLRNSATNRSYPFNYTISVANTWEQKSVTVAGDTTGTWLTTNGVGIAVTFALGAGADRSGTAGAWNSNNNASATGAVSVIGTLSATWQITGVQLEKGSTATSFDYRPYGTELALCQRYFISLNSRITNAGDSCFASGATAGDATYHNLITHLPVAMRAAPTLSINELQLGDAWDYGISVTSLWYSNQNTPNIIKFGVRTGSGATARRNAFLTGTYQSTASFLNISAEL